MEWLCLRNRKAHKYLITDLADALVNMAKQTLSFEFAELAGFAETGHVLAISSIVLCEFGELALDGGCSFSNFQSSGVSLIKSWNIGRHLLPQAS